jgi:4a-hydroxytetrahydrobiopterin dehydratase
MVRPTKLEAREIETWLASHPGWSAGDGVALTRAFEFPDFSSALAFVVRVGLAAEKRDHHPDVELGWGRARVLWTTHDAGGITSLDIELATLTDSFAKG